MSFSHRCRLLVGFADLKITKLSILLDTILISDLATYWSQNIRTNTFAACTNGTSPLLITSQTDADALRDCDVINGDIHISSSTLRNLTLNSIHRISGHLTAAESPLLSSLSAPDLEWINAQFQLVNLPLLTNISFPQLETITKGVYWEDLPLLSHPELKSEGVDVFNNEGTNVYGDLYVKRTGVDKLNFFNFGTFSRAEDIKIVENPELVKINLTLLEQAVELEITGNHPDSYVLIPRLKKVSKLTLEGIVRVDVESLNVMDGALVLKDNSFEKFTAPELRAVGGDFFLVGNEQLKILDLPALETIGGSYVNGDFKVEGNPKLLHLSLPALSYTDGIMNLTGHFQR